MTLIETVVGCLAGAYRLLRPGSILHVDELMKEKITNSKLHDPWFNTADGLVYSLQGEDRTPTLAITRGSSNPLFQDSKIDKYCQQLLQHQNYRPTSEETQRALQAKDTVLIDLTTLILQKGDKESSYLAINTREYNTLNPDEKRLAQRVYGNDFAQTMAMFVDAGIRETRVYVLNPKYVYIHAQESALGRASWLSNFSTNSLFNANGRDVDDHNALRGVRREFRP